ncbi:recombinase RecT [Amycolatopsis sp. DSM 110486]|uniref:recombinase RecT n=1 Tax=Amycolatopsis sp. DSM 110486 TaxID=2865832 RepID=UPI001C699616|nr:recombinase RecT [Amycolatopsis sp. DSM 110486]QYN17445.1 recombinase RecT [Amycolatopsis sp. DSM 110486]
MSNESARNAIAQRKEANNGGGQVVKAKDPWRDLIDKQKTEIGRALTGTALDPERFTRVALTVIKKTPKLMLCDAVSVLGALMTSAQLGLEPGPLGEAYLVPYGKSCQFIVGYQGYIKLAWNSGQIRHIDADVVRENDYFLYEKGAEPKLVHRPARKNRGDAVCYYAVASFKSGGHVAVVLSPEDVNQYRARSASVKSSKESPWDTDYDAMAKKTCLRRLSTFLPKSTGLARALSADESVRSDLGASIDEITSDVIDAELVEEPSGQDEAPATAGAPAEGPWGSAYEDGEGE